MVVTVCPIRLLDFKAPPHQTRDTHPLQPTKAIHSRVWLFSTLGPEQLLSRYLKRNLSLALKVLVETAFVIHPCGHNASYQNCSSTNLWKIRSFAGSQTLEGLEVALIDETLAEASPDQFKALFLALFGALAAVSYSKPVS